MNPDTSETLAIDAPELLPLGSAASVPPVPASLRRARARIGLGLALSDAQAAALRDVRRALIGSRLLIWIVGIAAVAVIGGHADLHDAYDPPGVTSGFGWLGNALVAPAARWDAAWYLVIAGHGYEPGLGLATAARPAFFPLYPWLVGLFADGGLALVISGVLVSLAALALALYGLHRLIDLELRAPHAWAHPDVPRLAVMLTAFAPMAFFLSAVYSESLYLALSIGVFWYARQGRWFWVGVLGGLGAATRSAGVVLLLPAVLLYFYGPREDRWPDRELVARWRPRYRLRADVAWLALIPAGLLAYMAWIALSGGDFMMPLHAQATWSRQFSGPFGAVKDGAVAAFDGLRQIILGSRRPVYYSQAGGSPFIAASHNIVLFVFLLAAVPAIVGVLRKLPFAYGAYVLAALAMPLSDPNLPQPLMSLPRFLLVLFPLQIWLAAMLATRRWWRWAVFACSGLGLVFFTGQFATWHWVA
ncbi:MAG TPA: mannosyltransferase family protein [Solirubrobacteraceae bacterium]|jgi:hypothetical protein|nr:mannosyltransferase family protein [Solirubrobacteraceae bacterium]